MDISKKAEERGLIYLPFLLFRDVVLRRIERPRASMSSSLSPPSPPSPLSSPQNVSVAVVPESSLTQPRASRRQGRRRRNRPVRASWCRASPRTRRRSSADVRTMAMMAVEEGQSRCLGGDGPRLIQKTKKGPGRLRGSGAGCPEPQPNL